MSIYEYATKVLIAICRREIELENREHYIIFTNEVAKVIIECMDYVEDLNTKEDYYKKYEIKPVFVPNSKKYGKNSSKFLEIDNLILICESLFEMHNIISIFSKE